MVRAVVELLLGVFVLATTAYFIEVVRESHADREGGQ